MDYEVSKGKGMSLLAGIGLASVKHRPDDVDTIYLRTGLSDNFSVAKVYP